MARTVLGEESEEVIMHIDYLLGAVLSVLITGYLVYALVRAERF